MYCPPVDLDHFALGLGRLDPIPQPEGLFEEHEQSGDDLPDRVLQSQADHDGGDTQSGEQALDVRAPDVGEDHRQAHRDQHETQHVEEDRRNPLAPGPVRSTLEQRGLDAREQQHQHHEGDQCADHPNRSGLGWNLIGLQHQQQQRAERQQVVPQYRHRAHQETLLALQRVLPLGEGHQGQRQTDGDSDRPVEPRRGEDFRHHGRSESRQIGSVTPSTDTVPAAVNSRVSCSVSCTREVT